MPNFIDLRGQRFGRLTVLKRVASPDRNTRWACQCDCGGKAQVTPTKLRSGHTQSCGCLHAERALAGLTKHGHSPRGNEGRTYRRWKDMKQRVRRDPNYVNRPITPNWDKFENFLADMGECPEGYSLERVNNDLGYFPCNCKWIPRGEQTKNTSRTVWITYEGRTKCVTDWAREVGMRPSKLSKRLQLGWPIPQALGFEPRRRPS